MYQYQDHSNVLKSDWYLDTGMLLVYYLDLDTVIKIYQLYLLVAYHDICVDH
jgi:hypothetical protein